MKNLKPVMPLTKLVGDKAKLVLDDDYRGGSQELKQTLFCWSPQVRIYARLGVPTRVMV